MIANVSCCCKKWSVQLIDEKLKINKLIINMGIE